MPNEQGEKPRTTISEKTPVSLGAFGLTLLAACSGIYWVVSQLGDIKNGQEASHQILRQLSKDCMTVQRFETWTLDLKDANPAIKVPRIELGGSMPHEAKASVQRGE